MLRKLAEECNTPASSDSLIASTNDWDEVGSSMNKDACERMVDDGTLGCTSYAQYESDALTYCSD